MPLNPIFKDLLKTDFDNLYCLGIDRLREWYSNSWDDFQGDVEAIGFVENRMVKTSVRDTPIRVYYPMNTGPYPVFVWIHGGGFVLGNIDVYDSICRKITNNVHCAVISIDYGLSPEYKFPEPLKECYQVIKWIYGSAQGLNINPDKIAIGGDSAGGTLSAAICQLSRDRREFPLIYQVQINAMYDLLGLTKPASRVENAEGYRLTTKAIEGFFVQQYLSELSDASQPLASPLLADSLAGVPNACIITSEFDPLRDEGEYYAKRLSEAGIEVCLRRFDGIIHGFFNMQGLLPEARDALALVCAKLSGVFRK